MEVWKLSTISDLHSNSNLNYIGLISQATYFWLSENFVCSTKKELKIGIYEVFQNLKWTVKPAHPNEIRESWSAHDTSENKAGHFSGLNLNLE